VARILIVHGISNQFVGEIELHKAWYPALCDGLLRAHYSQLPGAEDCFCPFYGDLFRRPGSSSQLGGNQNLVPEDLDDANEHEAQLLEAIWSATADKEEAVPSPEEYGTSLFRAPKIAERALNALAKSKFLVDYLPLQFFGDLKQVVLYLNDAQIRDQILHSVLSAIQSDTRIVIGHSLGSVVAYEAVCNKPEQVSALITLGSPLGIRNAVFDKLTPPPDAMGIGRWPGHVLQWTNVAAVGDIVAAQKELKPLFGNQVDDRTIDSGWDAHSSTRYLNSLQAGSAVAQALSM
jgi:hypothetical protein